MFRTKKLVVAAESVRRYDLFPTGNQMTLIVDTRPSDAKYMMEIDFVAAGDPTGHVHTIVLRPEHKVAVIRSKK